MAQLDGLDDEDADLSPATEEVNKRFTAEVREAVVAFHPELSPHFEQSALLVNGKRSVRFGCLWPRAILHFSVLHPVRQRQSARDARAKLWELSLAKSAQHFNHAALITAVPRDDDPTLGSKQREGLRVSRDEIERETDQVSMRLYAVNSVEQAVEKLLEVVA